MCKQRRRRRRRRGRRKVKLFQLFSVQIEREKKEERGPRKKRQKRKGIRARRENDPEIRNKGEATFFLGEARKEQCESRSHLIFLYKWPLAHSVREMKFA